MAQWEYKVVNMDIADRWTKKRVEEERAAFNLELNRYGADGWEMVQYEAIPIVGAWSDKIKGYAYLAMFKRQVA